MYRHVCISPSSIKYSSESLVGFEKEDKNIEELVGIFKQFLEF